MFKTRFISMLVLLMTAVTGAWATITVTWNNGDITGSGNSFTKDGVTITAGIIDFGAKNFMDGGTFTTTLGNFTKIEVTAADVYYVSGTGWSSSWTKTTWTGNASSVSFSGGIYGYGEGINFVFTIEPATVAVTGNEGATDEYWATYYNGTTSFTADENTTVFQAALSGSSLTLTEVPNREIPATKAVILKSSSATITLTQATTTATLDGNQLVGTATAITNPGNAYVLNKGTNGVGFYKLSSTGTIGANKAYLTYSSPSQARSFFGFDETTGIEMPTAEVIDADAVVYDLQGRRVAQPTKGLYIVNGKKVIIK